MRDVTRHARGLRRAVACVASLALAACGKTPEAPPRPPTGEFLLAAGDSTYWIRSGPEGVRVRSAPILLTRVDGKFYEVFVADDVHDFDNASFASAKAFRRDITRDDSLLIFADSTVDREGIAWRRAHPQAAELEPDDVDPDAAPPTLVTDDIEVVDVHGPWLTYTYSLNVDVAGRTNHLHTRRRGVLDLRDGSRASIAAVFGASEATRMNMAGALAFAALRDSIRNSKDTRGTMARQALGSFAFDTMNYGITDVGLEPAVSFEVSGAAADGEAISLFLPLEKVAAPAWWGDVKATLPGWSSDSAKMLWSRDGYQVVARPAVNGDVIFVSLYDRPATGAPHSWPIAAVPSPAYQLIPLDAPPVDSATRIALSRAFDMSTALDGAARQAGNMLRRDAAHALTRTVSRTTTFPACPKSRLRAVRMSSLPSAFPIFVVTSSACSRSRSASRYKAR